MTKPEALIELARRSEWLAKMAGDFNTMGTGEFLREYPDYEMPEGVGYIARHAKRIAASLRALAQGEG